MGELLEFLLAMLDLLPDGHSAWIRWLAIGTAILLLIAIVVATYVGQRAAVITGIVGTLVLVGGAIAVHDAIDTDA